ncbi:MAG: FliA/WhiG family RNA polymerase sigma factor [Gammaproteobacteria bacterium]
MHSVELYEQNADHRSSEQFVVEYTPLVKKIALHIRKKLPSHIELEDMLQSGFVGLLEAKNNFKTNMGATFETYASIRIHGAIIDALRKNSWGTRETSKHLRQMGEAISRIEQRKQQQATVDDVANELGITMEEHARLCEKISVGNVLSIDMLDGDNDFLVNDKENPQDITQELQIKDQIKHILTLLPEREQLILSLYYIEEFTFKQIGETLEVTEARICQLHGQAISRIQAKMK